MFFKIDENLPQSAAEMLRSHGLDVHTVKDEDMCGSDDDEIRRACRIEHRVIITADKDFSDLRQLHQREAGIVVLRHKRLSRDIIRELLGIVLDDLIHRPPVGEIWIVELHQVRRRKRLFFD